MGRALLGDETVVDHEITCLKVSGAIHVQVWRCSGVAHISKAQNRAIDASLGQQHRGQTDFKMVAAKHVSPYPHPAFPEALLPHSVQQKLKRGSKPHYPQEYLDGLKPYDSVAEEVQPPVLVNFVLRAVITHSCGTGSCTKNGMLHQLLSFMCLFRITTKCTCWQPCCQTVEYKKKTMSHRHHFLML